eukprot:PITA_32202
MLTEGNEKALGLICLNDLSSLELQRLGEHEWYKDIIYYLLNVTCPNHLVAHKRRALRLKPTKYCLMKGGLGWRNPKGIVLRCVDEIELKKLVSEFHSGFCGGHYAARTTAHKILNAGYYWPSIFSDVHKFVRNCQACQLYTGKQKLAALPLQPVVVEAPFKHWGLDFIGKFHENSSNGYSWILTATDYFPKWVEAIPAKNATEKVIMGFIENNIITRFCVPTKITTDNAKAFSSSEFSSFCFKYGIVLSHSSNYYPQGNDLAESSNKNLITIIKKIVGDNKRSLDSKINYQLLQHFSTNKDVVQNRIDQIMELDEARRTTFGNLCKNQSNIKKSFDKSSRSRSLQVGDMVLLWDCKNEKPGKHKKFDSLWLGPYIIRDIAGPNSFHLTRLDGEPLDLPANGQMLTLFFKDDI